MSVAVRRTVLVLVAAFIALAAYVAATSGAKTPAAHASGPTKTVHVKQASLTDQGCGDQAISGGHFVINQITTGKPESITVTLSNGGVMTVQLTKATKKVAQYTVSFAPGLSITDATAEVPDGWHGEFVLSNYLCGGTPTPTPTGSMAPPTGSMAPPSGSMAPPTGSMAPPTGATHS